MKKENRSTAQYEIPLEILDQIADEPEVLSLPHWHELVEIICIEEGELLLQLGEKKLTLTSGQIVMINQYGIHSTSAEKRVRGFVIFFLPSLLLNSNKRSEDERLLLDLLCGAHSLLISKQEECADYLQAVDNLRQIYRHYFSNEKGHTLFTRSNLHNFFGLLLSRPSLGIEIPNQNHRRQRERLDKISEILERRGTEAISLADIARELNLSTFRFCHIFKELTGYTFSQYLIRYRLLRAQEMLVESDIPVIEVAMVCGFNSVNYFNRVFKKITGYTPRAYRKKYRLNID